MADTTERVVVFIASSTCSGVHVLGIEDAVSAIIDNERAAARESGARFVAVGVAIDRAVDDGMRMLRRFGPFDEVVSGRGWYNMGAYRYIWHDLPGYPGVPQIAVVERRVTGIPTVSVSDERVLYRRGGGYALLRWADEVGERSREVGEGGV